MADELLSLANAVKRRARRERPYYTRDLPGEAPTERRRQVAAVLDRPEERRNPTRFVPDFQGVTALSRTEFKTDQREIEKSGGGHAPHPEDDDHDGSSSIKIDIGLPGPPVIDDGEARYKRFKRWSKDIKDVETDLARYRATIDLVRDELRRLENRGQDEEDRFMALRRHFLEYLFFLRAEKVKCDKAIPRLERLCEAEAGVTAKRKSRHQNMKEVLQQVKQQGKRLRELLSREDQLSERLSMLEAGIEGGAAAEYQIPEGDRTVLTTMGRGRLEKERKDGVLVVRFPFGVGCFSRANVTVHGKEGLGLGRGSDMELATRWTTLRDKVELDDDEIAIGIGEEEVARGGRKKKKKREEDAMDVDVGEGGVKLNGRHHGEEGEKATTLVPDTASLLPMSNPGQLLMASIQDILVQPVPDGFQALKGRLPVDVQQKWDADKAEILRLETKKVELEQAVKQGMDKRQQAWEEYLRQKTEKLKRARRLFRLRSRMADVRGSHRQLLVNHGYANGRLPPNLRAVVQHQLAAKGIGGQRATQQQVLAQAQKQQQQAAAEEASTTTATGGPLTASPLPNSDAGDQEGSSKKGAKPKDSDEEGKKGASRGAGAKAPRGNGKTAAAAAAGNRGETPTQQAASAPQPPSSGGGGAATGGQAASSGNTNATAAKKRGPGEEGGGGGSGTLSATAPSGGMPTAGGNEEEKKGGGPASKKARKGGRGK